MRPVQHAIISLGVGAGLVYVLKSYPAAVSCFIGGVFIDIDHYIDFLSAKKKIPNYQELVNFCDGKVEGWKPYLVLHSFEMILIAWAFTLYYQWNVVWGGLLIGATIHMICDQLANPMKPLGYLMLYRMKNNFDKEKIFSQRYFNELKQKKN